MINLRGKMLEHVSAHLAGWDGAEASGLVPGVHHYSHQRGLYFERMDCLEEARQDLEKALQLAGILSGARGDIQADLRRVKDKLSRSVAQEGKR